jgi:hypothetical protein
MAKITLFILVLFTSVNASAQFFIDNPTDSGSFYMMMYVKTPEKVEVKHCGKVGLTYAWKKDYHGFRWEDKSLVFFGEQDDNFMIKDTNGYTWEVYAAINYPTYMEFALQDGPAKGLTYMISKDDVCADETWQKHRREN